MERVPFDDLELDEDQVLRKERAPFTGIAFETSPSGHVVCEVSFVNGVQEGVAKEFFPSRRVESEHNYLNGAKHGVRISPESPQFRTLELMRAAYTRRRAKGDRHHD
jgi:hypothetical protein